MSVFLLGIRIRGSAGKRFECYFDFNILDYFYAVILNMDYIIIYTL